MSQSDQEFSQIPAELLQAIRQVTGQIPNSTVDSGALSTISTEVQEAHAINARRNLKPGDLVAHQGIYLCQYTSKLGKTFNVFAAPEDLPGTMTYQETVAYMKALEKWHGFDGTYYTTDKEFYAALGKGEYNGGWIIPPREFLTGIDAAIPAPVFRYLLQPEYQLAGREKIQPNNFCDNQNEGAFKDTFKKVQPSQDCSHVPYLYWSSTIPSNAVARRWVADITNKVEAPYSQNLLKFSCRPVRLVEIT